MTAKLPYLNTAYIRRTELEDVMRLFYPVLSASPDNADALTLSCDADGIAVNCAITFRGASDNYSADFGEEPARGKQLQRLLKTFLYDFLCAVTGLKRPWGSLTGIRPTALAYEMLARGEDIDAVPAKMQSAYRLSPEKAELIGRILHAQKGYYNSDIGNFDLYVNIPVCPSRCAYCSFISHELKKCAKLLPEYIGLLLKEIDFTLNLQARLGHRLRAVYIGGGTPSTLEVGDIARILAAIPPCGELTFEAGRADTVTREKLDALAAGNVTRISINPQTFNDATLAAIGRRTTSEEVFAAYALARGYSFDINMDLIAGLPAEGADALRVNIDTCVSLAPDNITVHTLAIKAGSRLKLTHDLNSVNAGEAEALNSFSPMAALTAAGYIPYYLYRQKYMLGGLENAGYTIPGKQCLFNIDTMEETSSVAACGAGAISKAVFSGGRIERSANVKNIDEYIERFSEMLERKTALFYDRDKQADQTPIYR